MSTFPISPVNGEIATVANVTYQYASTTNSWRRIIGNISTLSVAGNTTTGNLLTGGFVSATGNITGSYILGNGSQLTGLPAGYANSNAVSYGEAGWAGNIVPSANAVYSLGNATNQWKSLYVSNTTIYIGDVALSTDGNTLAVDGNAVLTNNGGNVDSGNLNVTGYVSATGNITGNYIIGNGSTLTHITGGNVDGTVANATYATSAGTAGTVTTAAQPNITSVGTLTSVSVSGNAVAGNFNTAGDVSATGNVYGNNIITAGGSGGNITGVNQLSANIVSATGNITGGNLTTAGSMSATGAAYVGGGMSVIGNLTVSGNINYQDVTDLVVGDPLIYIGANNTADLVDLGIVASANVANVYQHLGLVRNHATGVWGLFGNVVAEPTTVIDWANAVYQPFLSGTISSTGNISAVGNITGNYILGNGSQLTGISTTAFKNISVSGESNVAAANTPNIAFIAGTDIAITTDAANGTITFNYSSSSSIFATGGDMGSVASAVTSSEDLGLVTDSATVFYDLGSVTNDGSYTTLSVTGNTTTGNLLTGGIVSATGNIEGNYILGNGSQLTGISSGNSSINITVTEITANTTIAAGQNGFSVGPMSTADGVTVTIADGQRWVII